MNQRPISHHSRRSHVPRLFDFQNVNETEEKEEQKMQDTIRAPRKGFRTAASGQFARASSTVAAIVLTAGTLFSSPSSSQPQISDIVLPGGASSYVTNGDLIVSGALTLPLPDD